MRLGLMLGYWGLGLTAEDQRALLLEAESAGFDSVWTAEAYGSDAATPSPGSPLRPSASSWAPGSCRSPAARRR